MSEIEEPKAPSSVLPDAGTKAMQDFWGSMTRLAYIPPNIFSTSQGKPVTGLPKTWETALKTWQDLSSIATGSATIESSLKGLSVLPETFLKLAQLAWQSNLQVQKQVVERTGKIGQTMKAYNFDNLNREMFRAWTEIYEENFRQFLMIPQLGLSRFYRERLNRFIDKLNLFHTSFSEFMLFLYEPVEKSFKVMEETLEQLSKEGKKMPQASKEYYQLWIKILEEHFMTIFKSPAYGNILNETLCKLEEFLVAKDGILQDFLRVMPVPTNNEMDELYKEIHTLKKRVKEMENKNHKRQKKPDKD